MAKVYDFPDISRSYKEQVPNEPPTYFVEDKNDDGYFKEADGDKIYVDADQDFVLNPDQDRVILVPEEKAKLLKHLGLKGIEGTSIQGLQKLDRTTREFRINVGGGSLNSPQTNQIRGDLFGHVGEAVGPTVDSEEQNQIVRRIRTEAGEYEAEKKAVPAAKDYLSSHAHDKRVSGYELDRGLEQFRVGQPAVKKELGELFKSYYKEAVGKAQKALTKKNKKEAAFYAERAQIYIQNARSNYDSDTPEAAEVNQAFEEVRQLQRQVDELK